MSQNLISASVVPPGRILLRELEARGWTQKDLAEIMGRPLQAINEIIRGSKQITPETALELAETFGTSPELWTNLEADYRLHLARQKKDGTGISRRSLLFSLAPVSELLRRSWIGKPSSPEDLERGVCAFLGISSLDETPKVAASFRHAEERGPQLNAQIAWVKRVEHLARAQQVPEFDRGVLERAIPEILANAVRTEDVSQVPSMLLRLGIHFVIVPHLPKTYLDGAALYLDGRPVVALTLRYDRVDAFWFTLMHELGHIVAGHQGVYLDSLDSVAREGDADEREANHLASEWLVRSEALAGFINRTKPRFSRARIIAFAEQQRRHPGIVLGQLQRNDLVGFGHLRSLLVRVGPLLKPWIDVPSPQDFSLN
ncbi:MAG: HigA family addiction module antitoxin [Dehalococcoidia bacterium]|nr:HigA family addiction module antitoxin [Dehalococcoidia bacterium]